MRSSAPLATSRHATMILANAAAGVSAATSSPRQRRAAFTAACTCGASRPRSQQQRLQARRRVQRTQAAAADAYAQPAPDAAGEDEALEGVATAVTAYGSALYRFSRPHTLFGTFVSVCSVSSLALVRQTACTGTIYRTSVTQHWQLCVCSCSGCHIKFATFHSAIKLFIRHRKWMLVSCFEWRTHLSICVDA